MSKPTIPDSFDELPDPWGKGPRNNKRRSRKDSPPPIVKFAGAVAAFGILILVGLGLSGKLGVTTVEAHQVGVKVNYLTGSETVVTQPGYQFYIPFLQEVYKFDRTTQEYVMSGTEQEYKKYGREFQGTNRAPRLTVRANDGSTFWFEELKIQYDLVPGAVDIVLQDSGPGEFFKQEWIKAHARSILRDEFGRYSAVEVANPTVYKQAPEAARSRLNAVLEPHGINVVRIITPNPKFDPKYERAIETRKEADQEVEELKARVEKLEQVREQRLAAVRKDKEVQMQELTGDLRKDLLAAERDAIQVTKAADAFAATQVAAGKAQEAERSARATGLVAKYTKEAEGILSRAQALESRGQIVVREALIKKLLGVNFTLVPYSRDPAPQRLEHSGTQPALVPVSEGGDQ